MNESAYRWLVSDAAKPYLKMAGANLPASPKLISRLRKDLVADQANLVCQQAELRQRARAKFSRSGEMFFTPIGYEQSTDEKIAKYKAQCLSTNSSVADLCCGIGGDLIAMAQHGTVTGVDRDFACSIFASANLATHQSGEHRSSIADSKVICGDIADIQLSEFDAWHIDPDRRPGNKRTTNVDEQEPSWSVIESLLTQNPNAMIKLAPAAEPPQGILASAECEWIGNRRECKQLLIRCGNLARHPGQRTATIVDDVFGDDSHTLVSNANRFISHQDQVGKYLFEPHPTLLAAGIVQDLAAELGLRSFTLVSPGGGAAWGYLTSDDAVESVGFTGFDVATSLPFDRRQLVATAADNGWNIGEVKKRGVNESPKQIRSWFSKTNSSHGDKVTLIVAPTVQGVRAMFARRMAVIHESE